MKPILIATFGLIGLLSCSQRQATHELVTRNSISKTLDDPQRKKRSPETPWEKETQQAFAIEKSADVVVDYSADSTMVIRSIRRGNGVQPNSDREFQPNQLIHHFDSQPRKDLALVIIAKQMWSDGRLRSEINKLNQYFFARDYRRVVIQQGLGGGRGTHSDLKRPSTS